MTLHLPKEYRKPALLLAVGLLPALVLVLWPDNQADPQGAQASEHRNLNVEVVPQDETLTLAGPDWPDASTITYRYNTPKAVVQSLSLAYKAGDLATLLDVQDFDTMAQMELEQVMPVDAINESLIDETTSAMQRGFTTTFTPGQHALVHADADRIRVLPNQPVQGVYRVIVPCVQGDTETHVEVLLMTDDSQAMRYKVVGIHNW